MDGVLPRLHDLQLVRRGREASQVDAIDDDLGKGLGRRTVVVMERVFASQRLLERLVVEMSRHSLLVYGMCDR